MDFTWSNDHAGFRSQVQEFISREWRGGGDDERRGTEVLQYQKSLAEHGWLTMAWPEEYGGRAASHWQQMIFAEESAISGAPTGGQGADRVGPTLMIHRTEA